MATTETVPMDDAELFQSATADEPVQETPVEETPATEPEQPRDEQGRFAQKQDDTDAAPIQQQPVAEQTPTAQPTTTKDDTGGQVPSWRLREVSEQRTAAEKRAEDTSRQLYQLQVNFEAQQKELAQLRKPKEEPVDIFTNPAAFMQQTLTPIEERFSNLASHLTYRASLAENTAAYGKDAIAEMREGLRKAGMEGHPGLAMLNRQMDQSDDPVGVAMQWHQREKLVKETGGDIASYKQKLLDEAMKDPEFQAKVIAATREQAGQAQPGSRPVINLPPSLNKAPGAGGSNASAADDNDASDAGMFRHATAGMRR